MKIFLLLTLTFTAFYSGKAQCNELFISEYVEGWSNNKAIEIANPTSAPIYLANYELRRYSNGSSSAGSDKIIQLSGIIEAKGIYVFVIDQRDTAGSGQTAPVWDTLQNKADAFICPNYTTNNVMYFNGNDAIVLLKGSTIVDVFGKVGEDPGAVNGVGSKHKSYGWPLISVSGDSTAWTKDHVLRRKYSIEKGDVTPTDAFDPRTEWDSLGPLDFSDLGLHDCSCGNLSSLSENVSNEKFNVYPNPSNTGIVTINSSAVPKKIEIISILGSRVASLNATSSTIKINTSDYTKGIYFVALTYENGQKLTKKIVIN